MPEFMIRTAAPSGTAARIAAAAAVAVDSRMRVASLQTLEKTVDDSLERERLLAFLSSAFGFMALVLAAVGVYGVIAYGVARRTSEIGLRMALGADRTRVLKMIVKDAAAIPLAGLAAGAPIAWLASRIAGSLLFGVQPGDPWSLAASGFLITAVSIIAAAIPALRAMRINPISALRHE